MQFYLLWRVLVSFCFLTVVNCSLAFANICGLWCFDVAIGEVSSYNVSNFLCAYFDFLIPEYPARFMNWCRRCRRRCRITQLPDGYHDSTRSCRFSVTVERGTDVHIGLVHQEKLAAANLTFDTQIRIAIRRLVLLVILLCSNLVFTRIFFRNDIASKNLVLPEQVLEVAIPRCKFGTCLSCTEFISTICYDTCGYTDLNQMIAKKFVLQECQDSGAENFCLWIIHFIRVGSVISLLLINQGLPTSGFCLQLW